MLSAEDNELLTRTGPGTPMGELFRRFWMPVLLVRELPEPDGPPVRVTRAGRGARGVPRHERAGRPDRPRAARTAAPTCSSAATRSAGCAASTTAGSSTLPANCVDMPTMARDEGLRVARRRSPRTRPREWGDIVWAYLGPPEHQPDAAGDGVRPLPPTHRFVTKKLQECNWAQACEGALDTAHFSFLHTPLEVPDIPPDAADPPARRRDCAG